MNNTPPQGYIFKSDLFHDLRAAPEWYWIVWGNLLALVPLGFAALLLWLPYQFYVALGTPLALFAEPAIPDWSKWVIGFVVIVASMLLHELLHAAALRLLGYRAHLNYAWGYFYATVEAGQFLTRSHYILMSLTPLTVVTVPAIGAVSTVPSTAACALTTAASALLTDADAEASEAASPPPFLTRV